MTTERLAVEELAEFLRARLDEQAAQGAQPRYIEAQRQLITEAWGYAELFDAEWGWSRGEAEMPEEYVNPGERMLWLLAVPYEEHPEFQMDWHVTL